MQKQYLKIFDFNEPWVFYDKDFQQYLEYPFVIVKFGELYEIWSYFDRTYTFVKSFKTYKQATEYFEKAITDYSKDVRLMM